MKNIFIKKVFVLSIISFLFLQTFYILAVEPTLAMALNPDAVAVSLTVDSGITISSPANVTMSAITMSTAGSIGNAVWNVKTNNAIGYDLKVHASAGPALVSGVNSFADYTEATPTGAAGTPKAWSVETGNKEFGYSAFGSTTSTTTWGAAASCGSAGVPSGTQLYVGFNGTTDKVIATSSSSTISGVDTTICFAAQQVDVFAPSGAYAATITATASTR